MIGQYNYNCYVPQQNEMYVHHATHALLKMQYQYTTFVYM